MLKQNRENPILSENNEERKAIKNKAIKIHSPINTKLNNNYDNYIRHEENADMSNLNLYNAKNEKLSDFKDKITFDLIKTKINPREGSNEYSFKGNSPNNFSSSNIAYGGNVSEGTKMNNSVVSPRLNEEFNNTGNNKLLKFILLLLYMIR